MTRAAIADAPNRLRPLGSGKFWIPEKLDRGRGDAGNGVSRVLPASAQQIPAAEKQLSALPVDPEEPEPSAQGILAALQRDGLRPEEKRRLVIEAEVLTFGPGQVGALRQLLRSYIERHRDSDDPADLIAVASAIRKYVATGDKEELSSACFLLDAGHRASVPLEIELEVAKMVARKLAAGPLESSDSQRELADRLMDLVRTYLNVRLLPREKYGAVALNSVFALVLLRSSHVAELLTLLKRLRLPWFKQLVARRARRIQHGLSHRLPEEKRKPQLESLDTLIQAAQDQSP